MIDYGQFAARLAERSNQQDRWSLLEAYVREWGLPVAGEPLYSAMDLADAEDRLGVRLPPALREWYLLPWQPYQLTTNHVTCHHLLGPHELQLPGAWLVFQMENQDCCEWAVRAAELHLEDPPVYIGSPDERGEVGEWVWHERQNATLSEFVLQLVMRETLHTAGYDAYAEGVDAAAQAQVEQAFQPLGLPVWLEMGAGMRFYGGPDALVLTTDDWPDPGKLSVYLGARSHAGLELALGKLTLNWTGVNDSGVYQR